MEQSINDILYPHEPDRRQIVVADWLYAGVYWATVKINLEDDTYADYDVTVHTPFGPHKVLTLDESESLCNHLENKYVIFAI